jgi:hypothetical protein
VLEAVGAAPLDDGLPLSRLAAVVFGAENSTRSQMVSLRRAVRRLQDEDLVTVWRDPAYPTPDRSYWRRTGRTVPCPPQVGRCPYCAAGHPAHGAAGGAWHVEYGQVRSVVESWVRKHPSRFTEQEAAEAEQRRKEALQRIAALQRVLR